MKTLFLMLALALPAFSCSTPRPRPAAVSSSIQKHRDKLVYLVNSSAASMGAYVISIHFSAYPTEEADWANGAIVLPNGTLMTFKFVRRGELWEAVLQTVEEP